MKGFLFEKVCRQPLLSNFYSKGLSKYLTKKHMQTTKKHPFLRCKVIDKFLY